jgi:outer membrane protein
MKIRSLGLSSLFSLALASGALGQTTESTPSTGAEQVLSLDQAITRAMTNNYGVIVSQNQTRRSELEVRRNEDALLPSVSGSAGYNYNYDLVPQASRTTLIPADPLTGAPQREIITPAGSHGINYSVNGNLNIFNGGSDAARIRSAKSNLQSAQSNLTWTRQLTAFNVTSSYVNALRTKELVASSKKTLAESQAELNRVKGLFDAGSIPIGQVYQQEAVVGQNELSVIQAQNNFENAKADLLFLLDIPPNEYNKYNLTVQGIDTSTTSSRRVAVDTTMNPELIESALNARPDIASARAAIEAAEAQVAVIRGELLPSLDATASIGGGGANSDLFRIHSTNDLSAGLRLSVPIFDRFQNEILIQEQQVQVETQRVQLQQDLQGIRSDIAKAENNVRAADQALDASDRALRSAEESLRLAEERLKVGAGTQVDVIVAQAQVETARTNRVNAKYNFVLAQRQLQYTLGRWNY